MHIVLVSPAWPIGYPNGIVTYVHHLRFGLRTLGHDVSILALQGGEGLEEEGVYRQKNISAKTRLRIALDYLLGKREDNYTRLALGIAESIIEIDKKNRVNIVEMEETFGVFLKIQKRLRFPFVIKLHGPAFLTLNEDQVLAPSGIKRISDERQAIQNSLFVISPSKYTLRRTQEHCELSENWGRVIPNPVCLSYDFPIWDSDYSDPQTLLFVGRFDRAKGGDFLIRAFAKMLLKNPQLKLVFVGPDCGFAEGYEATIHIREYINKIIPIDNRSQIVIHDRLDQSQIVELRQAAAVTLVCSRFETFGYTIAESMMQGCPLVSINSGATSELIQHEATGLLAEAENIEDFCDKVLWLLDNPDAARKFGAAARVFAVASFDAREVARKNIEVYRQAIDAQGAT